MKKRTTELMIFVFTALAFSYFSTGKAGTCSSITRSSFGANTVLTSAELNSQFSTVYSHTNDLDGGCITDGTLEFGALNTSDFQPLLNSVKNGCSVSKSSASAVSISPCSISVNGNMVYKSGNTVVSMGCGDCSSETASTDYYVYIKGDSSGSTINGFLSTTAPDTLGNNGTARVLARIRNDSSSDILEYGIDQWNGTNFVEPASIRVEGGALDIDGLTTDPTKPNTGIYIDDQWWYRRGQLAEISLNYSHSVNTGANNGSGNYTITLPSGLQFSDDVTLYTGAVAKSSNAELFGPIHVGMYDGANSHQSTAYIVPYSKTTYRIYTMTDDTSGTNYRDSFLGSIWWGLTNTSYYIKGNFRVPIEGFYDE